MSYNLLRHEAHESPPRPVPLSYNGNFLLPPPTSIVQAIAAMDALSSRSHDRHDSAWWFAHGPSQQALEQHQARMQRQAHVQQWNQQARSQYPDPDRDRKWWWWESEMIDDRSIRSIPPQAPFTIKEDSPLYNIFFDERWDSNRSESDDPDFNRENDDPDYNTLIDQLIAKDAKEQIGQMGSLADEDHNLNQAATADTSYLPDANWQGEPRYTCSPELLQRLTNFILPPSPAYSGHENTKECTGFLCVNKTSRTLEIVGDVVENTGKPGQPSVHREYPEHDIEIHPIAFHTHPYHSKRKFNPPTTADVKLFSMFCSYSRAKRLEAEIRTHHIVFTMQGTYVMHDSGISKRILDNLKVGAKELAPVPFRKQVCEAADKIFNGNGGSDFEKQLLQAFPNSPGLAGVDRASDNTEVRFFQHEKRHKVYLDFFKRFGITIDFFAAQQSDLHAAPNTEIALRFTKL
jgi:hypothetical protein